ncbi:MAG: Crp/Fnr family transcriptional regulator [Aquabacterium sp.]|nr:Crp/Fnr family transcriptional regulator [Aquabacterium sp.]
MSPRRTTPLLLDALAPSSRDMIKPLLRPWKINKGAALFRQGDPMTSLYFLDSGFVLYEVTKGDGRHMVLGFSRPDDCIGDLEIFANTPALCTAVAHTAASGWQMDATRAISALDDVPGFAKIITTVLATVSCLHRQMYEYASLSAPHERLAAALLLLSDASPRTPPQISQAMLARLLALSRQCVGKHLNEWAQAGWIDVQYRSLRVINRDALSGVLQRLI